MKLRRRDRGDESGAERRRRSRGDDAGGKRRRRGRGDDTGRKRRRLRLAKDRRVEAVGIAFIAFGFLCTALVWMGVRDSNNVAFQLPIIASGGLVAVGCFIVGGLLVVGGLVMTRFARLEKARTAGAPEDAAAPMPDGSEAEVSLAEEEMDRREKVMTRQTPDPAASES